MPVDLQRPVTPRPRRFELPVQLQAWSEAVKAWRRGDQYTYYYCRGFLARHGMTDPVAVGSGGDR